MKIVQFGQVFDDDDERRAVRDRDRIVSNDNK